MCRARGRNIWVQFEGGTEALERAPLAQLRQMPFRWTDIPQDGRGWIDGEVFRAITSSQKRGVATQAFGTGRNEDLKNYYDRASSLGEMLRICDREGDRILVGFEGGRGALRRSTPPVLQARQFFKWDYLAHPVGIKDHSNWIRGDEFAAIVRGLGGHIA